MPPSTLTGDLMKGIEAAAQSLGGRGFEPVLRLGVTGLARSGKTVFITALVANLLERGRMGRLRAEREGRIRAVHLQPQPDLTLPRFAFEDHLAALTGPAPHWPASTRAVSELRLSFLLDTPGPLGGLAGQRRLHLDIVDYPGEWLLDLALLDKSYGEWSEARLERMARDPSAAAYLARARAEDGALVHDEMRAQGLAADYRAWLAQAREAGHADGTPGRFLLPGELEGSPVLSFAPLPQPALIPRGSLWREMARRYEGYKDEVVRPFFRDHFARIDRQIVLADVLGAIHGGPRALEDLRQTLSGVLSAFRPGRSRWLAGLLGGRRVERILFAATRADHLHHGQHAALSAITSALLAEARARADFAGAATEAMALAALRATVETEITRDGQTLGAVRGRVGPTGQLAALYAGELPADPARLLAPARAGADRWLDADYALMAFAPARLSRRPGEGLPHIRLDRAAEFLIGDRL